METPKDILKSLLNLGFTQRNISELTDVSQPTLSRILTNPKSNPSWQTVEALKSLRDTLANFDDVSK